MNWELIKNKLCRLVATAAILLGGAMLSAAASGSMPFWAAILGLFAAVIMLNAVCGILLAHPEESVGQPAPRAAQAPCGTTARRARRPRGVKLCLLLFVVIHI